MDMVETMVIENNNPNLVFTLFFIIAVVVIIVNLIGIKFLIDRKKTLEDVKKKIEKRHETMVFEARRKEQREIYEKESNDLHNPF